MPERRPSAFSATPTPASRPPYRDDDPDDDDEEEDEEADSDDTDDSDGDSLTMVTTYPCCNVAFSRAAWASRPVLPKGSIVLPCVFLDVSTRVYM